MTTTNTKRPVFKILSELCETTAATIRVMETTETTGSASFTFSVYFPYMMISFGLVKITIKSDGFKVKPIPNITSIRR